MIRLMARSHRSLFGVGDGFPGTAGGGPERNDGWRKGQPSGRWTGAEGLAQLPASAGGHDDDQDQIERGQHQRQAEQEGQATDDGPADGEGQ